MSDKEKVKLLRNALYCLLSEYEQYADNACHCEEYQDELDDDEDNSCPYCYAKDILNKTK